MAFYWINIINLVEVGGPFDTIGDAENDAVASYLQIGDVARAIEIVQTVKHGSISLTPKARWIDDP